jgi:hypothetical protein
MSEELEMMKLVCSRLEQSDVPYMLTGSFAANFYAVPRMTRDIDIVIELQKVDVDKVFKLFKDEFYLNKNSIEEAVQYEGMFNIIHNILVFKVDFIIRKGAHYRNTEFQRKKRVLYDNVPIWIVAPEDLIISKLCWAKDSNSEMQIKDVQNLLQTVKSLDENYISNWVQALNLNDVYERVLNHA